jgi:hypothetical protein
MQRSYPEHGHHELGLKIEPGLKGRIKYSPDGTAVKMKFPAEFEGRSPLDALYRSLQLWHGFGSISGIMVDLNRSLNDGGVIYEASQKIRF